MKLEDLIKKVTPLLSDSQKFQQLTQEDKEIYGTPELIVLSISKPTNPDCALKLKNWLDWRAAPYKAERHSEYLFLSDSDFNNSAPRILVSAILKIPNDIEVYLRQFNNKQRYRITGQKALNMGYTSQIIKPQEYTKEIWEIIHSCKERQGRPIAKMFLERDKDHKFSEYKNYIDPLYQDICVGVFSPEGQLIAYLLGKRVGEHIQYDEIMGHYAHLKNNVMFLLHYSFLRNCLLQEKVPTCLNYSQWYSGTNPYSIKGGLNFWKRKTRFQPAYLIAVSC